MNAKVEIIVNQLADVIYVPVQSIEVDGDDHHFCYVSRGGSLERRSIVTGQFNDEFIEVQDGLQPGEDVALTLPKKTEVEESQQPARPAQKTKHGNPPAKNLSPSDAAISFPASQTPGHLRPWSLLTHSDLAPL